MPNRVEFLLTTPLMREFKVLRVVQVPTNVLEIVKDESGKVIATETKIVEIPQERVVAEQHPATIIRLVSIYEEITMRRLTVRFILGRIVQNTFEAAVDEGIVFNDAGYTTAGFDGAKTEESVLVAITSFMKWPGKIRPFAST